MIPYQDFIKELHSYIPENTEPNNFDIFWKENLESLNAIKKTYSITKYNTHLTLVDVYQVIFNGFANDQIYAWLIIPKNTTSPLPCVIEFLGYGGGYGNPWEHLFWANSGYAHLIMDTRGQGCGWENGRGSFGMSEDTVISTQGHHPGKMTQGIENPQNYYYKRVFLDAVRSIEIASEHPLIDNTKIILNGTSQGGGIALAASALSQKNCMLLCDVPFLCDFNKAITTATEGPYLEIKRFFQWNNNKIENGLNTLSYFDGIHFAKRIKVPSLFSVGLQDTICPPHTVFGAYNRIQNTKEISIWHFNGHEGGEQNQLLKKIQFIKKILEE